MGATNGTELNIRPEYLISPRLLVRFVLLCI